MTKREALDIVRRDLELICFDPHTGEGVEPKGLKLDSYNMLKVVEELLEKQEPKSVLYQRARLEPGICPTCKDFAVVCCDWPLDICGCGQVLEWSK